MIYVKKIIYFEKKTSRGIFVGYNEFLLHFVPFYSVSYKLMYLIISNF